MIPLIVSEPELELLEQWAREEADKVLREPNVEIDYLVGTMIETPRAALVADAIADVAEFFSFGTNDLTQMTFGFSRDDIEGRFMSEYLEHKLLVGEPVREARRRRCRPARAHGLSRRAARRGPTSSSASAASTAAIPASVAFCHEVGLDYVSCSPYRVPIARLAAAHAAVGTGGPGASA